MSQTLDNATDKGDVSVSVGTRCQTPHSLLHNSVRTVYYSAVCAHFTVLSVCVCIIVVYVY